MHLFHKWIYKPGGKYDIAKGWGARYRTCLVCGKHQIFDDFMCEYLTLGDINGRKH